MTYVPQVNKNQNKTDIFPQFSPFFGIENTESNKTISMLHKLLSNK
jgi:hypothetical protein